MDFADFFRRVLGRFHSARGSYATGPSELMNTDYYGTVGIYSKTYNYLDTVGEVTNLASGGGTELPLSEMSTYFSTF